MAGNVFTHHVVQVKEARNQAYIAGYQCVLNKHECVLSRFSLV